MTRSKGLLFPGVIFLLTCLMTTLSTLPALAQTELNRISAVERNDGMGYVVRYHLTQQVDSFKVRQPSADLIQMKLFADELDTTGVQFPPSRYIRELRIYPIEQGYGFDIQLAEQNYYRAQAYPDQNEHDLLLALTETSRDEILSLAAETEPVIWNQLDLISDDGGDEAAGLFEELYDEGYTQIRDNLNFDTVVIDAGHGGRDPGTIGHGGVREKDVTLAVALKLGEYIQEHMPEINVVYTRERDNFVELEERGRTANRERGDLFISIHANAYQQNPQVRGSEIYFLGLARSQSALEVMKRENSVVRLENGNGLDELTEEDLLIYELANAGNISISERIAGKLEHQFRERAQRPSRGVKQAQFVVLYHASMPALLVELGFITNPDEARFLSSEYGQSIVASAIFRAIRDYRSEYERSRNLSRSR